MEGRIKKIIIRITALSLFLGIVCFSNFVYAAKTPEIRELDADFLDITEIDQTKDSLYKSEDIKKLREQSEIVEAPVLKGGISELKAIVGKSQILKFDQPIQRLSITKTGLVELLFLSPKEILMNGLSVGETTVIIWGEEEKEPIFFNLFVENNNISVKANFTKEVKKIAPNEDIKIEFVDSIEKGLQAILTGKITSTIIKEKIDDIAEIYGVELVDLTETLTPQIMLEVKIVEIGNAKNKSRGFKFKQGLYEYLDYAEEISHTDWFIDNLTETIGEGSTDDSVIHELISGFDKRDLRGTVFDGENLNYWKALPGKKLSYLLSAAEGEDLAKIIAEPKIMVINGEKATLETGTKINVQSGVDQLGNIQYTRETVGPKIYITPEILEETEMIRLEIKAVISELGTDGNVNERLGETKVEVKNNHTTVISGLVRKSESNVIVKFPFLSNLPLVGKFFNNVTSTQDETELMIFVTPTIIKPDLAREGL